MKNEYATKDLYIAAFLQVNKQFVKKLEQNKKDLNEKSAVYFIFDNKKKCEELVDVFWSGDGEGVMVNVKEYFTAIRDLKSRISSMHRAFDRASFN